MLIDIHYREEIWILECQGRFEAGEDPEYLDSRLDELRILQPLRVLADFRQVTSIGSTGLGFLVCLFKLVTRHPRGRFALVAPNDRVRRVLDITKLDTVIPIAENLESGMAMLGQAAYAALQ